MIERFARAETSVIEERRRICGECPELKPATPLMPFARCAQCGCLIAGKTALASQSCPLKKW